jgi:glycosyltransferase involved in cell wall biosynthesis
VKASIVIPTLNEERRLGGLLSDLAAQTQPPDEVLVVDAGSTDGTVEVARRFRRVEVLEATPPVARGRNLGGMRAGGDVVVFFDADVRFRRDFLAGLLEEMERRWLDVACPAYVPEGGANPTVRAFHAFFNALIKAFEGALPSGAGHCIAVRGDLFRASRGFDPGLKFDDIELVRRLSRGHRFGVVGEKVYVSDRRYREDGTLNTFMRHLLMSVFFALGKFEWANRVEYEFGKHAS